jgi:hypothetical protein
MAFNFSPRVQYTLLLKSTETTVPVALVKPPKKQFVYSTYRVRSRVGGQLGLTGMDIEAKEVLHIRQFRQLCTMPQILNLLLFLARDQVVHA